MKILFRCFCFFIFIYFFADNINCQNIVKGKLDKNLLPQPIYSEKPEFVDLYWKTWELAWDRVRYQNGVCQSPYMDENLWDDTIWIWDTEFMVLFCRYAPKIFPGIQSLDNFYESILNKKSSSLRIQHPDNPPFYPWVEYEYYKMTGDRDRIRKVVLEDKFLQRHYHWFESLKSGTKLHFEHAWIALEKNNIGYRWGGIQSGMDNTPRGRDSKGELLWMDAMAQQALAALYIARLADELDNEQLKKEFMTFYEEHKNLLNKYYWDDRDGFYYDLSEQDTSFVKVRTPTVYWAMLAEIPDREQANKLANYAVDSLEFGGKYPWPSVSRRDKDYNDEIGDYWRGGIWLPLAYMSTKALEKYGYYDIAYENSYKLLSQMSETYINFTPSTIWECYSPSAPHPSERQFGKKRELVRPDFCGWSALGPISLFIENVLGFYEIDAIQNIVKWNKRGNSMQGIKNLKFGNVITDIVAENKQVQVKSQGYYILDINGKKFQIKPGETLLKL